MVGPVGFEPTTKGFTLPHRFRREWTISSPSACAGGVRDARCLSLRALKPPGSLCTFRRCTAGSAQGCHQPRWKVSLNSSRPLRGLLREGTFIDESPALTAVLQAPAMILQNTAINRMESMALGQQFASMEVPATLSCVVCGECLYGKRTVFCSRHCKNRYTNYHHQSYG